MGSISYGNPVTRIRSREKGLLDQGRINRMLEVQKEDDLLKILAETEYSLHLKEMDTVGDYEDMLSKEMEHVYHFLKEITPVRSFQQLITLPHDLQNLKIVLKSRHGERPKGLMNRLGLMQRSSLEEALTLKGWKEIVAPLGEPLLSLGPRLLEETKPQYIDIFLDKARFHLSNNLAKKIGSRLLIEYFGHYTDLLNIEIFIRARSIGEDTRFLEHVLVKEGSIDHQVFLMALKEPLSFLLDRLKMGPYGKVTEEGLKYWQEKEDLSIYEKLRDNLLMNKMKKAKFIFFGPEPLFGYLLAKETEIKTLRMIFISKINRLPEKVVRERLRDLYV